MSIVEERIRRHVEPVVPRRRRHEVPPSISIDHPESVKTTRNLDGPSGCNRRPLDSPGTAGVGPRVRQTPNGLFSGRWQLRGIDRWYGTPTRKIRQCGTRNSNDGSAQFEPNPERGNAYDSYANHQDRPAAWGPSGVPAGCRLVSPDSCHKFQGPGTSEAASEYRKDERPSREVKNTEKDPHCANACHDVHPEADRGGGGRLFWVCLVSLPGVFRHGRSSNEPT